MVLLYDRAFLDPRVTRVGDGAHWLWMTAITECNIRHRETLAIDELRERIDAARDDIDLVEGLNELVDAELAELLPHGHVRMLARLDLWAFDDEAEPDVILGPPVDD